LPLTENTQNGILKPHRRPFPCVTDSRREKVALMVDGAALLMRREWR